MPELPEIARLAGQMNEHLAGKTFAGVEVAQPKSLNIPSDDFARVITGAQIRKVDYRGKWTRTETSRGWLLTNLGMGGEILLVDRNHLPAKRRLVFGFTDGMCLSVNFWWFGYVHYAPLDELDQHEMTARLGPNVIDLSLEEFRLRLDGQRGRVKALLLDQSNVAGIGNAYIHDILFLAGIHPQRKIDSLSAAEVDRLYQGIRTGLLTSLEKGAAFYEVDLFGQKGGFSEDDILIGYRENQPCPNCQTPIQKIKTGSTSSFICPVCQPLEG